MLAVAPSAEQSRSCRKKALSIARLLSTLYCARFLFDDTVHFINKLKQRSSFFQRKVYFTLLPFSLNLRSVLRLIGLTSG